MMMIITMSAILLIKVVDSGLIWLRINDSKEFASHTYHS